MRTGSAGAMVTRARVHSDATATTVPRSAVPVIAARHTSRHVSGLVLVLALVIVLSIAGALSHTGLQRWRQTPGASHTARGEPVDGALAHARFDTAADDVGTDTVSGDAADAAALAVEAADPAPAPRVPYAEEVLRVPGAAGGPPGVVRRD